jgi:hypothetical protein
MPSAAPYNANSSLPGHAAGLGDKCHVIVASTTNGKGIGSTGLLILLGKHRVSASRGYVLTAEKPPFKVSLQKIWAKLAKVSNCNLHKSGGRVKLGS